MNNTNINRDDFGYAVAVSVLTFFIIIVLLILCRKLREAVITHLNLHGIHNNRPSRNIFGTRNIFSRNGTGNTIPAVFNQQFLSEETDQHTTAIENNNI